jgi:hypothetical protein
MVKMLSILYCQKCRDELWKSGEFASTLFDAIVENYLVHNEVSYFYHSEDDAKKALVATKYLESKGYVVSTETAMDCISIKPLGIRCFEGLQGCLCHVCIRPNEHTKTEEIENSGF